MIDVTREQLYEEVWTEPMTKVSVKYGISDVALKKICKKYDIPTPIQGHWAKLAAGKTVKKISLRSASNSNLNKVIIYGAHSQMSQEVAKKVKEVGVVTTLTNKENNELEDIGNPEHLQLSAQLMKERLLKAKPDKNGLISLNQKSSISVSVAEDTIDRATTILHRVIVEGIKQGVTLAQGNDHLEFLIDGEYLSFTISEALRKETHIMSDTEVIANSKWQKKRKNAELRQDWDSYISLWEKPFVPEYDYYPNGKLAFQFNNTGYTGIRGKFADGKIQTVETLIESIILTAKKHVAARIAIALERQKQDIEREDKRRIREDQSRLDNLEEKRKEVLIKAFKAWSKVQELRKFITEAKTIFCIEGNNGTDIEWINWADSYIEQMNPFRKGVPTLLQMDDFSEWELTSRY